MAGGDVENTVLGARPKAGETAALGESIYAERLRDKLEPEMNGRLIVIDVATGDYAFERDKNSFEGTRLLQAKNPDARLYLKRIGYPYVDRMGGRFRPVPDA